jgi:acyl carrier protein
MPSTDKIYEQLWDIFDDLALVEKNEAGDVIIHNDQIESIQFMSIIIDIEDRFGIEIPDEYLLPDFMSSFQHICDVIKELIDTTENNVVGSDTYNNTISC